MGHFGINRMPKSHVADLSQIVRALLEDAKTIYPGLERDFARDFARLSHLVCDRGISVFVTDMPAAAKHLDKCLARGEYITSGLPLTRRVSRKVVIPKFLRGLYLLIFHEDGRLKEDYDAEAITVLRQVLLVGKKAKLRCSDSAVLREIREFCIVDARLRDPSGFWNGDTEPELCCEPILNRFDRDWIYTGRAADRGRDSKSRLHTFLCNLDKVSRYAASTLGHYDPLEWKFRHGPGVVSNRSNHSNKYKFVAWGDRLETAFPIADCGYHNHASWAANANSQDWDHNDPRSRLIDVPKTYTKPRLIAAEPSEHMWCQQNIWHFLCERVKTTWIGNFITFRDQAPNQRLCKLGSREGHFATVDLSAASDRVTCRFVECLFGGNVNLLKALRASRTAWIETPQLGLEFQLKKFSTMGNACTFPVQSIGFMCIAIAAVATSRGLDPLAMLRDGALDGEVAVFGDDIIVPTDSRELLFEGLEILDFKVNQDKSFWTGRFRESCGVDAFDGVDITPVYWRAPCGSDPESIVSFVTVRNSFYRKGYFNTVRYLDSTIRVRFLARVPVGSGHFGLESWGKPDLRDYKTRWNGKLHRFEFLSTVAYSRQSKEAIEDDSALLQFFTEDPDPTIIWRSGVAQRPKHSLKLGWAPVDILEAQPELPGIDERGMA